MNRKGFTLIELLIVVVIIGILAAIAIPQFANYRNQAFCSRVESDVKNTVTALEAFYAQNETYDGFTVTTESDGVTVTANAAGSVITDVSATHANCDHDGDGTLGDTFTFTPTASPQYTW